MKIVSLILLLTANLIAFSAFGQADVKIEIPTYKDKYSKYVKNLELGQVDIDYQDFRFSFLESEQFNVASQKSAQLDSLEGEMYAHMKKSDYQEIIKITKQMLSIDYTSMIAHKILRQTYKIIEDTDNAAKYKAIQFGLLYSIIKKGDGQTCATAWPVIQLSEEYFILKMVGAELEQQSIDNNGGICDKIEVSVDEEKKIYYFETSKVFQGYKKLGIE